MGAMEERRRPPRLRIHRGTMGVRPLHRPRHRALSHPRSTDTAHPPRDQPMDEPSIQVPLSVALAAARGLGQSVDLHADGRIADIIEGVRYDLIGAIAEQAELSAIENVMAAIYARETGTRFWPAIRIEGEAP